MGEYLISLTPFKELKQGEESIYDYIDEAFVVPDKVLLYLQGGHNHVMSPGIYDHPFKKGETLLGPYIYTDDKYVWDRDTWKYVKKYHLRLPEEFIEYVMAKDPKEIVDNRESWNKKFKEWGVNSFLPENGGDVKLDDF